MERLTEAVTKDAKKAAKKAQAEKEKKAEEDDKMFDGMSKAHLKRVLEKKGLETKGKKAELIERIKSAGIDVAKELDPAEAAEIEEEEKAKAAAKAHLEKVAGEYADMKAPELRLSLIHISEPRD